MRPKTEWRRDRHNEKGVWHAMLLDPWRNVYPICGAHGDLLLSQTEHSKRPRISLRCKRCYAMLDKK